MKFDKDNGYPNPNYDTQVAAVKEGLALIEFIEKNLDYVTDGLPEYQKIKEHVETFVPVERIEDKLSPEEQHILERKFEELKELAQILK